MADNLLYVVFHGLISLVENKTTGKFKALLLEMNDHRVAAGHWLTETTMAKGVRLELTGVDSGNKSLDPQQNIILTAPQLNTGAVNASLFAEITLPKPREAHSFKGVDVQLQGPDKNKVSSTRFSATQVFVYKMTSEAQKVTLTGQLATGAPVVHWTSISGTELPQQGITVSVLHILNEPEEDIDDQHALKEFMLSATLFGANLGLTKPARFPETDVTSQPPAGLLDAELLALSQRESNVFGMLAGLRQKTNTHLANAIGASKVCGPAHGLVAA